MGAITDKESNAWAYCEILRQLLNDLSGKVLPPIAENAYSVDGTQMYQAAVADVIFLPTFRNRDIENALAELRERAGTEPRRLSARLTKCPGSATQPLDRPEAIPVKYLVANVKHHYAMWAAMRKYITSAPVAVGLGPLKGLPHAQAWLVAVATQDPNTEHAFTKQVLRAAIVCSDGYVANAPMTEATARLLAKTLDPRHADGLDALRFESSAVYATLTNFAVVNPPAAESNLYTHPDKPGNYYTKGETHFTQCPTETINMRAITFGTANQGLNDTNTEYTIRTFEKSLARLPLKSQMIAIDARAKLVGTDLVRSEVVMHYAKKREYLTHPSGDEWGQEHKFTHEDKAMPEVGDIISIKASTGVIEGVVHGCVLDPIPAETRDTGGTVGAVEYWQTVVANAALGGGVQSAWDALDDDGKRFVVAMLCGVCTVCDAAKSFFPESTTAGPPTTHEATRDAVDAIVTILRLRQISIPMTKGHEVMAWPLFVQLCYEVVPVLVMINKHVHLKSDSGTIHLMDAATKQISIATTTLSHVIPVPLSRCDSFASFLDDSEQNVENDLLLPTQIAAAHAVSSWSTSATLNAHYVGAAAVLATAVVSVKAVTIICAPVGAMSGGVLSVPCAAMGGVASMIAIATSLRWAERNIATVADFEVNHLARTTQALNILNRSLDNGTLTTPHRPMHASKADQEAHLDVEAAYAAIATRYHTVVATLRNDMIPANADETADYSAAAMQTLYNKGHAYRELNPTGHIIIIAKASASDNAADDPREGYEIVASADNVTFGDTGILAMPVCGTEPRPGPMYLNTFATGTAHTGVELSTVYKRVYRVGDVVALRKISNFTPPKPGQWRFTAADLTDERVDAFHAVKGSRASIVKGTGGWTATMSLQLGVTVTWTSADQAHPGGDTLIGTIDGVEVVVDGQARYYRADAVEQEGQALYECGVVHGDLGASRFLVQDLVTGVTEEMGATQVLSSRMSRKRDMRIELAIIAAEVQAGPETDVMTKPAEGTPTPMKLRVGSILFNATQALKLVVGRVRRVVYDPGTGAKVLRAHSVECYTIPDDASSVRAVAGLQPDKVVKITWPPATAAGSPTHGTLEPPWDVAAHADDDVAGSESRGQAVLATTGALARDRVARSRADTWRYVRALDNAGYWVGATWGAAPPALRWADVARRASRWLGEIVTAALLRVLGMLADTDAYVKVLSKAYSSVMTAVTGPVGRVLLGIGPMLTLCRTYVLDTAVGLASSYLDDVNKAAVLTYTVPLMMHASCSNLSWARTVSLLRDAITTIARLVTSRSLRDLLGCIRTMLGTLLGTALSSAGQVATQMAYALLLERAGAFVEHLTGERWNLTSDSLNPFYILHTTVNRRMRSYLSSRTSLPVESDNNARPNPAPRTNPASVANFKAMIDNLKRSFTIGSDAANLLREYCDQTTGEWSAAIAGGDSGFLDRMTRLVGVGLEQLQLAGVAVWDGVGAGVAALGKTLAKASGLMERLRKDGVVATVLAQIISWGTGLATLATTCCDQQTLQGLRLYLVEHNCESMLAMLDIAIGELELYASSLGLMMWGMGRSQPGLLHKLGSSAILQHTTRMGNMAEQDSYYLASQAFSDVGRHLEALLGLDGLDLAGLFGPASLMAMDRCNLDPAMVLLVVAGTPRNPNLDEPTKSFWVAWQLGSAMQADLTGYATATLGTIRSILDSMLPRHASNHLQNAVGSITAAARCTVQRVHDAIMRSWAASQFRALSVWWVEFAAGMPPMRQMTAMGASYLRRKLRSLVSMLQDAVTTGVGTVTNTVADRWREWRNMPFPRLLRIREALVWGFNRMMGAMGRLSPGNLLLAVRGITAGRPSVGKVLANQVGPLGMGAVLTTQIESANLFRKTMMDYVGTSPADTIRSFIACRLLGAWTAQLRPHAIRAIRMQSINDLLQTTKDRIERMQTLLKVVISAVGAVAAASAVSALLNLAALGSGAAYVTGAEWIPLALSSTTPMSAFSGAVATLFDLIVAYGTTFVSWCSSAKLLVSSAIGTVTVEHIWAMLVTPLLTPNTYRPLPQALLSVALPWSAGPDPMHMWYGKPMAFMAWAALHPAGAAALMRPAKLSIQSLGAARGSSTDAPLGCKVDFSPRPASGPPAVMITLTETLGAASANIGKDGPVVVETITLNNRITPVNPRYNGTQPMCRYLGLARFAQVEQDESALPPYMLTLQSHMRSHFGLCCNTAQDKMPIQCIGRADWILTECKTRNRTYMRSAFPALAQHWDSGEAVYPAAEVGYDPMWSATTLTPAAVAATAVGNNAIIAFAQLLVYVFIAEEAHYLHTHGDTRRQLKENAAWVVPLRRACQAVGNRAA